MERPRAWPLWLGRNPLLRALLGHQFWRKAMGRLGPRYLLAPVGPAKMCLDLRETIGVSRYILKHGEYDPFISACMKDWIGPRGSAIDLGANIGYHSLLAASLTRGEVYAFEPEPRNFDVLRRNIDMNGLANIRAFRKAAGDRRGALRLYLSSSNSGDHRCFSAGESRPSIEIEVVRVDEELAGLSDVRFVKIDVQGFEEPALRGMEKILARSPEVKVVSEFEPKSILASGARPEGLLDFMASLGFGWRVVDQRERSFREMDLRSLVDLCGGGGHADLLFSRR